jgi:1,4-dihydroxy-2-naphthoate octaprenyltransferase
MNASNYSDLMNWIGVLIIVITVSVCYTVIRVKRGYPPLGDTHDERDTTAD